MKIKKRDFQKSGSVLAQNDFNVSQKLKLLLKTMPWDLRDLALFIISHEQTLSLQRSCLNFGFVIYPLWIKGCL